jgi:hypothetical protein
MKPTKLKPLFAVIEIPIFKDSMNLVFGMTVEQAVKEWKSCDRLTKQSHQIADLLLTDKTLKEHLDAVGNNAVTCERNGLTVIFLKGDVDEWVLWEVLLHETSHATEFLMARKGIDDDETRAYLHEWLFRQCRRLIQRVDKPMVVKSKKKK